MAFARMVLLNFSAAFVAWKSDTIRKIAGVGSTSATLG
jgi:hypothetical protein